MELQPRLQLGAASVAEAKRRRAALSAWLLAASQSAAQHAALDTKITLTPMHTNLLAATRLAVAACPPVLADLLAATVLAPTANPLVLANFLAATILAVLAPSVVYYSKQMPEPPHSLHLERLCRPCSHLFLLVMPDSEPPGSEGPRKYPPAEMVALFWRRELPAFRLVWLRHGARTQHA